MDFETALQSYLEGCQRIVDAKGLFNNPVLEVRNGRRYVKLVLDGSAYSFVDKETGNVLKPASWSKPAKHARGNIFDDHNGLKFMQWSGPAYLR